MHLVLDVDDNSQKLPFATASNYRLVHKKAVHLKYFISNIELLSKS